MCSIGSIKLKTFALKKIPLKNEKKSHILLENIDKLTNNFFPDYIKNI